MLAEKTLEKYFQFEGSQFWNMTEAKGKPKC